MAARFLGFLFVFQKLSQPQRPSWVGYSEQRSCLRVIVGWAAETFVWMLMWVQVRVRLGGEGRDKVNAKESDWRWAGPSLTIVDD